MKITIDTQRAAAVFRQVLAVAVSVYTVIATNQGALHLSPAITAILTAFGPVILAIEHSGITSSPASNATTTPPPTPVPEEIPTRSPAMPPKAS